MTDNKEYAVNIRRLPDGLFAGQADMCETLDEALRFTAKSKPNDGTYYEIVEIRYDDNENEIGTEVVAAIM